MERKISMTYETNQTEINQTNNHNKTTENKLFTDEAFSKLTQALKDIRDLTKPESKSLLFEKQNTEINQAKQEIEDKIEFAPSYKKMVNQIISEENTEKAKHKIIKHINENQLNGYTPDFQILVNEIMSTENINQVKQTMIQRFEMLNT